MVLAFPSTHLVSSMSSIILFSWLDNGLRLKLALPVKVIYFADIYYRETLSFQDLFMTGRTLRLWFNINCTILFTSGADLNIFFQTALSATTITSHSVQGIDDVYAIFNKYRQLDQFHGHANSSHVSSLLYSHIFIIKYFVRFTRFTVVWILVCVYNTIVFGLALIAMLI